MRFLCVFGELLSSFDVNGQNMTSWDPEGSQEGQREEEVEMRAFCVELPPSKLDKFAKISRVSFAPTSSLRHRQTLPWDTVPLPM